MYTLRQIIRQLVLEAYEMTPEDIESLKLQGIEKGGMMAASAESGKFGETGKRMIRNMRRAKSRQYPEEQEYDRKALKKLHSTKGYQTVIDAFQAGKITAIYDTGYGGTFTRKGSHDAGDLGTWMKKYGSNSKDAISTKAFRGTIKDIPPSLGGRFYCGFIIEGYPIFATKDDAYSQTHSAAPGGLVDHTEASGFAKRGDLTTRIKSMRQWKKGMIAEEAVLDNWDVVGIVIREKFLEDGQVYNYEDLGLPVYIVNDGGFVKEL